MKGKYGWLPESIHTILDPVKLKESGNFVNHGYYKDMKTLDSLCHASSRFLVGLAGVLFFVAMLAFSAFILFGAWDLLVWALRSDWRSTQFELPATLALAFFAIGFAAYIAYIFGRGLRIVNEPENADRGTAVFFLAVGLASILIIAIGLVLI